MPTDDPERREHEKCVRESRPDGADHEEDGRDPHCDETPVLVSDAPRHERARSSSDERRRNRQAERHGARMQLKSDRGDRAVDHGAIVAEEKPAERGNERHENRGLGCFSLVGTRAG